MVDTLTNRSATVHTPSINKTVAMVAGAILALVGILGFFMDPVLGIFEVSVLHNIVHLLSGIALLAAAFVQDGIHARRTLLALGIVYALVTLLGFVATGVTNGILGGNDANPALNMPDNVLHLLLAIAFIAIPLLVKEDVRRPVTGARRV